MSNHFSYLRKVFPTTGLPEQKQSSFAVFTFPVTPSEKLIGLQKPLP